MTRAARTPFQELWTAAAPALREALHGENVHGLPRVRHVVVASGVGKHRTEGKFAEQVERGLTLITGQKPAWRAARKSIAGFKLRTGQVVGFLTTLRGRRMEEFLLRLLWVALPRVRDFRGLSPRSVDPRGNLTIGLKEASVFPEADPSVIDLSFGLQITIVTTAQTHDRGLALFRALGVPFAES
jgi:large subunit ribosomal protein L5